tara:strand:- start:3981 stop:7088 length:3108 start_codon:yes stop_codon:yes gene_type:complete
MLPPELCAKIQKYIKERAQFNPESFKEKLFCTYQLKLFINLAEASQEDDPNTAIEKILKENWDLISGTCLSYTALPEDESTLLLCDIAEHIGEQNGKPALKVLIPTIAITSIHDDYPDLVGNDSPDIRDTLKTHILSQSGTYLIPLLVLGKLTVPWNPSSKLPNYYYDYASMLDDDAFIRESEYQRLLTHSKHTQDLSTSKENYEDFLNDKSSLLGHLNTLSKHLRFNSASGIGQEENAGEGAYNAILRFNEYYSLLTDAQKSSIPEAVKSEVVKLLNLSSDATVNHNATENLETCIATRESALNESVKENEVTLIAIGISDQNKQVLLEETKRQFSAHQEKLITDIQQGEYSTGRDPLGITHKLLKALDITSTIDSSAEFQDFLSLSAADIKEVAESNNNVRQGIVAQFNTIESFVMFCATATNLECLQALLSVVGNEVLGKLARRPEDLSACLLTLDGERLRIVCNAAKDKLPDIIKDSDDFGASLTNLTTEQRTAIFNAFQDKLPDIIKDVDDFVVVLEYLSAEQCAVVCNAIKVKLPDIIKNRADFGQALRDFSIEQCTAVYSAVKNNLPNIIKNCNNFAQVLGYLSIEQCATVCNAAKDQLPDIIKDRDDFRIALAFLSAEKRTAFFNAFQDKLPNIIKGGDDFSSILRHLTTEQCIVVCNAVKNKRPDIIKDGDDFRAALTYLTAENRTVFFNVFQDKLPDIIKDGDCFKAVLGYLTVEQCKAVCNAVKNKWPDVIKDGNDFVATFTSLADEKRTAVLNAFQDKLPDIIKDGYDFEEALLFLTTEECTVFFNAVKNKWPDIIKDGDDFRAALAHLTAEQCAVVCNAVKKKRPEIIKEGCDFGETLACLTDEKRIVFFNAFQNQLPTIIKNDEDYKAVPPYLWLGKRLAQKSKNIKLKAYLPGYILAGLIVGLGVHFAGYALIVSVLGLIIPPMALLAAKYYKKQQFNRLSYPLFFKSIAIKDNPVDNVDNKLKAYSLGKDAEKSWKGYFTSYTKPSAYLHYSEFCTGKIEAEGKLCGRRAAGYKYRPTF